MTWKADPSSRWLLLTAGIAPIVAGIVAGVILGQGSWLTISLWALIGIMLGLLLLLIVLGRRAEKVAYSQIEGKPGAVGAVLKTALPRNWAGTEMPVNVNPKTQDAIYRVIGPSGVTLIAEGPKTRTERMLDEERRKVKRVVANVEVHYLYVGPDSSSVPLHKLRTTLGKNKRSLGKYEVAAVANRLNSLQPNMPIPKGIDPLNARPDHKSMRGR